jgi:hypothetical protein
MESMEMTRCSAATDLWHTHTLPMSHLQLLCWTQGEPGEMVASQFTPDERRFLTTDVVPEETTG